MERLDADQSGGFADVSPDDTRTTAYTPEDMEALHLDAAQAGGEMAVAAAFADDQDGLDRLGADFQ
jgi:hypothetical protein